MAARRRNPLSEEPETTEAPEPTGDDVRGEIARLDAEDDQEEPVNLDEPPEPGTEEEESQEHQARPSKRRRGQSYKALQEQLEQLQREREQERGQLTQQLQMMHQNQQLLQQQIRQGIGRQEPQEDPREKAYKDTLREEELMRQEYNSKAITGQLTQKYEEDFAKRWQDVRTRQIDARLAMQQSRQPQRDPRQESIRYAQMQLQSEFPDVYRNEQAYYWAEAETLKRMKAYGKPLIQAGKEALAEARQRFFGGGGEAPASLRQKLQGPSRGAGGGNAPTLIARPREGSPFWKQAVSLYDDEIAAGKMTEDQAVDLWVREVGPDILKDAAG